MEFILTVIGGIASFIGGICTAGKAGISVRNAMEERRRKEQEALPENNEENTEEEA